MFCFCMLLLLKKYLYKIDYGGVLISMIQNIYTYDYIIKKYSSMEKIHNNNVDIRDSFNIDKKSILCANTNVRGYINFLFNRSIYENIENIEKCKTISKDKDIKSVIFIHTERPFTDIHKILKIEVHNNNSNTTKTYPKDESK